MIHLRILKEIYKPLKKCDFFFLLFQESAIAYKRTKKAFATTCEGLNLLERVKRFELSTHGLGSRYSTTELHPHYIGSKDLWITTTYEYAENDFAFVSTSIIIYEEYSNVNVLTAFHPCSQDYFDQICKSLII